MFYRTYTLNSQGLTEADQKNTTYGHTNGTSKVLADLDLSSGDRITQFMASKVKSNRVDALQVRTKIQENKGNPAVCAGKCGPFGILPKDAVEVSLPIFGFFGAEKDGDLVSLGTYTLEDFSVPRGKTGLYGGRFNTTSWDDSFGTSFKGTFPPLLVHALPSLVQALLNAHN